MSKGKMVYVMPTGDAHTRTVKVTTDHANFLRNKRDNQSHPTEENPTFAITKPVRVSTIAELMEPDPPVFKSKVKWMAICEANAIWPYTTKFITESIEYTHRQRKRFDYREEGVQHARSQTVRAGFDEGMMSKVGVVMVIAFCVFAILTALVIANYRFNRPAPATTSLIAPMAVWGPNAPV